MEMVFLSLDYTSKSRIKIAAARLGRQKNQIGESSIKDRRNTAYPVIIFASFGTHFQGFLVTLRPY
jgi:hypothetical protein